MIQTIEQAIKTENKRIKIPAKIRPFDVGYRIVNEYGQALALRNGAIIFDLPSMAVRAIKKEFGKMIQTLTLKSILLKRLLLSI